MTCQVFTALYLYANLVLKIKAVIFNKLASGIVFVWWSRSLNWKKKLIFVCRRLEDLPRKILPVKQIITSGRTSDTTSSKSSLDQWCPTEILYQRLIRMNPMNFSLKNCRSHHETYRRCWRWSWANYQHTWQIWVDLFCWLPLKTVKRGRNGHPLLS